MSPAVEQSEARAAKNEISFREANEKIGEKRTELDVDGPTPFLCECSDPRCTEVIRLTLREYEHARSNATWFVVALGHDADGGTPVEESDTHAIVKKTGIAGLMAVDEDPRGE